MSANQLDAIFRLVDKRDKLLALLRDWQEFATDVSAADCAGQEWLDMLRARTEEVLKP